MWTDPFQALVQPISGSRASRLDIPSPLTEGVQAELVSDVGSIHGVGQVLWRISRNSDCTDGLLTCLLAKTSKRASLSSSSLNIRWTVLH